MASLKGGASPFDSPDGRKNMYVCDTCRGHIVTRDVDEGTTPFMLACRATAGCKGRMRSSMYRVFDGAIAASHEWYRPPAGQTLTPGEREHVAKGGVLLRVCTVGAQRQDGGDKPLAIKVIDGALTMEIGVRTLAFAIANRPEWTDDKGPRLPVHDAQRFAELIARELSRESEIADLLDEAADGAIEQGDACCTWRESE
jgi:hypothetical protein